MAIALLFILGILNFAMHRAVMESGHPMLRVIPWYRSRTGIRLALIFEFAVLLAAMLLAANGWPATAWGYLFYSLINGASGWLMLSGRV